MAPRLSWTKLLPGIVAIVVIAAIGIGVLVFAGVGRIRGEKIRLFVVTSQARGVMKGTEVWVAGQQVGSVEDISFRPPGTDTTPRVVIAMDVRASDAGQIRRDSEIHVRSGTNVIGPMVVYLIAGTPASPPVRSGDTLFAPAQSDLAATAEQLGAAVREAGPLMADAKAVVALTRNANGTVGAMLTERGGGQIERLRAHVSRLRESVGGNDGARQRFLASARQMLARADSIRTLVTSDRSSLGRFRRDSTLSMAVASARDEAARLRALLADESGSLARFGSDSAVTRALADAQRELALLFEDIRKRPIRYIAF